MNVKLNILLGAILAVSASQVFAAQPITTCDKPGQCGFQNLQPWNNGQGLAAYYYCKPLPTSKTFTMSNFYVLITGFDKHGQLLNQDIDKLNTYAFGAYLDPVHNFGGGLVFAYDQNNQYLSCYPGNPENRPIWPGLPGTRISRQ